MHIVSTIAPIPRTLIGRLTRFLKSPADVKYLILAKRLRRADRPFPSPIQLGFGMWWLVEGSALDKCLLGGSFEIREIQFVGRFLKPGTVVLDIGAHHGYYTLLASQLVGPAGSVISFEPSARECERLRKHVRINSCLNVQIQPTALGENVCEADLFLVEGQQDWCNSLRPPTTPNETRRVRVPITTVDQFLHDARVLHVDFIKLDVEGAELSVLKGATRLLSTDPRPVMLVEVQEIRTRPWGYGSTEIIEYLQKMGYSWFRIVPGGLLEDAELSHQSYDGNFVACPRERVAELPSNNRRTGNHDHVTQNDQR